MVQPTQPRVAVLTSTLPERHERFAECARAVRGQTLRPAEHLVFMDFDRIGCAEACNRLLAAVSCEWLALIADDDLMHPRHLETLVGACRDADVVYSWCRVIGREGWNPNSYFEPERLRDGDNFIPATTLIRTSLARELGGWRSDAAHGFEDLDFWQRALDAGARFVCVPKVTWDYVFHGGNASWRSQ